MSGYGMLSNLRDYLEEMKYAIDHTEDTGPVDVELSTEEVTWVLDQVYFALRHEDNQDDPMNRSQV